MMPWLLAALGLAILLLAGDALVRGAVNLSLRLGIPALIVSLTIVAFGTSAPELLISVKAVVNGVPGIALGNVVGSNTANILLVLGLPALLKGLATGACDTRHNYVFMLGVSLVFIALCFTAPLTALHGSVLLVLLAVMLWDQVRRARAHQNGSARHALPVDALATDDPEDLEGRDPEMPRWQVGMYLVLGLVGLPLGAEMLINGGVEIARAFGLSEAVIGLTLIALGTSLPELATTAMAAYRDRAEVALGNVLGSNMFNLLAIIGVTCLVGNVPVGEEFLRLDLWVMLGASLLIAPFVFLRMNITRPWGALLTVLYLGYVAVLLG